MSLAAGTSTGAIASTAAGRGQPNGPPRPVVQRVTTGPARSLGEPSAAQDGSAGVVTATIFGATGTQAAVWIRRADTAGWRRAGSVLPAGFGSSYDPAAAAAAGGPMFVVAGAAPPGETCIDSGSVAIASVDSRGRLGTARLVSDQRGTGSFDDRPMVAVGQHGLVWVAWSQGPDADACQDVGTGDRIEVAVSRDGGRTFGDPVAMPAHGGHSAFGARLVPLPGDQVAVSWTETMENGDQSVLVSVLGAGGRPGQPQPALTGDVPPLTLPGASFYDFPAGDIAALPGGNLVVAAPSWVSGRSVIKLAAGRPGGPWHEATVRPPAGSDLLLPALAPLPTGNVRLLCAVHIRREDRLGYDWTDVTVSGAGTGLAPGRLTALTPAPSGPGFFEIGEELMLARTRDGLRTAVVVAGQGGAALETVTFSVPAAAAAPPATPAPSRTLSPGTPTAPGRTAPAAGTGGGRAGAGRSSGFPVAARWLGAGALCCAAAAGAFVLRRRR